MRKLKPLKKFVIFTLVFTTYWTPGLLNASALDSALDGMFVATSAPEVYKSQSRMGLVGGSIAARVPIRSYNIVSFDPPRLNAGCGGIDIYGGSFSFINADQLVNMLRQIGQQAKALLFKLAIDAINQMLGGVLSEFAKAMQDMNALMKNTCAISTAMLDDSRDLLTGKTDSANRTKGLFDSASNSITDFFKSVESSWKSPNNVTAKFSNDLPSGGNVLWRALVDSKVEEKIGAGPAAIDPLLFRELIMSIGGIEIMPTDDKDAADDNGEIKTACAAGASCGPTVTKKDPTDLKVSDFISPSENSTIWQCSDRNTDINNYAACQTVQQVGFSSAFMGTAAYVNKMLWGVNKDQMTEADMSAGATTEGIVNKLRTGSALTPLELRFLNSIPQPILAHLRLVQRSDEAVQTIATLAAKNIAEQLAVKMADSLVKAARLAWSAKATKASAPGDYFKNLDRFQSNINVHMKSADKELEGLLAMQEYVEKVAKSLPGAFMGLRKSPG